MNQKKYWLRGGLTLALLDIVLILSLWNFGGLDGRFIFLDITQPVIFESGMVGTYFQGIISYFISGSLLGWIYGKIKNTNKVLIE